MPMSDLQPSIDPLAALQRLYADTLGSVTDGLTGAYTYGIFQAFLTEECNRCQRDGDWFSLALVDVDFLGRLNAQKGPLEGDQALKKIAEIIAAAQRAADIVARYSDDLFAVLWPKTNLQEAFRAAERMRTAIDQHFHSFPTVSIGVATCPEHGAAADALVAAARQALAQAKLRGHNRTVACNSMQALPLNDAPRILIVDDDHRNLKLLETLLTYHKYEVVQAHDGEEALSAVRRTAVDMILSDVMMPRMDGFELCRRIKQDNHLRLIPVVMLTALDDVHSKVKAIEAGADDFMNKPPNQMELCARIKSLVSLKRANSKMTDITNVIFSMANAVEAKDGYTQGHIERVSDLAARVGRGIGLAESEIEVLKLGGALHDIGKIAVPDHILNKAGPLSAEEWVLMKEHCDIGHRICLPLKDNLGLALSVIRHHHEKLDGTGYPDGLAGGEIPMVARIMAVVDIYDALTTDRPYRKGMEPPAAFQILEEDGRRGKLDASVISQLKTFLSNQE